MKYIPIHQCADCPMREDEDGLGGNATYCGRKGKQILKSDFKKGSKFPSWCPLSDYAGPATAGC